MNGTILEYDAISDIGTIVDETGNELLFTSQEWHDKEVFPKKSLCVEFNLENKKIVSVITLKEEVKKAQPKANIIKFNSFEISIIASVFCVVIVGLLISITGKTPNDATSAKPEIKENIESKPIEKLVIPTSNEEKMIAGHILSNANKYLTLLKNSSHSVYDLIAIGSDTSMKSLEYHELAYQKELHNQQYNKPCFELTKELSNLMSSDSSPLLLKDFIDTNENLFKSTCTL